LGCLGFVPSVLPVKNRFKIWAVPITLRHGNPSPKMALALFVRLDGGLGFGFVDVSCGHRTSASETPPALAARGLTKNEARHSGAFLAG